MHTLGGGHCVGPGLVLGRKIERREIVRHDNIRVGARLAKVVDDGEVVLEARELRGVDEREGGGINGESERVCVRGF